MSERKLRKAAVITAALILILFLIPVKINYNDGGTVQYCSDPKKLDKNLIRQLTRIESCIEQGSVLLVCS